MRATRTRRLAAMTMKQRLHLAGWHRVMNVTMKQRLHPAGWHRAINVRHGSFQPLRRVDDSDQAETSASRLNRYVPAPAARAAVQPGCLNLGLPESGPRRLPTTSIVEGERPGAGALPPQMRIWPSRGSGHQERSEPPGATVAPSPASRPSKTPEKWPNSGSFCRGDAKDARRRVQ